MSANSDSHYAFINPRDLMLSGPLEQEQYWGQERQENVHSYDAFTTYVAGSAQLMWL